MPEFPIQPIERFAGKSAAIRRPREIACFSYDDDHRFRLDDSSLRYYYPPALGTDLCGGFDTFRKLDDTADDHLDSLLATVMDLERRTGTECQVDVITWRGMMTKLMAVPYEHLNGFEMNATCFQGTIFIEENHAYKLASKDQQMRQPPRRGGPSQEMMSYWGYKFETISLLPEPWDTVSRDYIENRDKAVVDNHAQYCSIVKTGIGNTSLIIGGEVDAIWDAKPPLPTQPSNPHSAPESPTSPTNPAKADAPPINWVELKTAPEPRGPQDMVRYERRLLKFWLQSYLLGVPRIIVGFRSPNGVLQALEELNTTSLPSTVKMKGQGTWDGNICIRWGSEVLDFLNATIQGDGVYRIRRAEKSPVLEVTKVEETGHGRILSDEFLEWRRGLQARRIADMLAQCR